MTDVRRLLLVALPLLGLLALVSAVFSLPRALYGVLGACGVVGALLWIRRAPRRKAVVFDFDRCLMKKHWWMMHHEVSLDKVNPQPQDFGHPNITAVLARLLSDPQTDLVAVASFGRADVIRKALSGVVEQHRLRDIYVTTPKDFGLSEGTSMGTKDQMLTDISKRFHIRLSEIVFFDDTLRNVEAARKLGVRAYEAAPFSTQHEHHLL